MPGIVEFPKLVQHALAQYGDLCAHECPRRHFAESLTGLSGAARTTVLGIPDEFAQTTDLSRLNRYLAAAAWEVRALNERRLERLQEDPTTRHGDQGVIPIDHALSDRDGLLIPDAGWYCDHAEERYKIAQDYLFVNHVRAGGKHDPLEFRLFREEAIGATLKEPLRNHAASCRAWIDGVGDRKIPGDRARDRYFTSAEVLNHIHAKTERFGRSRGSVGDLKTNRKLEWKGETITVK